MGNYISTNFFNLCIADFGLSKIVEQKDSETSVKKRNIFGVLPYIAPEVLCEEEYTKAADIYSYAIIAYEIVTGFAPYYDMAHDMGLAIKICNGLRPKIPFYIPKLIAKIIMKCWDSRVTHRPTFKELKETILGYYKNYEENNFENDNEITIQIKQVEKISKNKVKGRFWKLFSNTKSTITPMNYKKHPEAIYTSRLLSFSSLPKPNNAENFERELEGLTKSTSPSSLGGY